MGRRSREKTGPFIPRVYIRELREARELSLAGLLKRVAEHGVQLTPASLSRVERSLQPVDTPTLHAIAKALGVSLTTVLTGMDLGEDAKNLERLSPRDRQVTRQMIEGMLANQGGEADAGVKRKK